MGKISEPLKKYAASLMHTIRTLLLDETRLQASHSRLHLSHSIAGLPVSVHGARRVPRFTLSVNRLSQVFTFSYRRSLPLNNGAVLKLSCLPAHPFPKGHGLILARWSACGVARL